MSLARPDVRFRLRLLAACVLLTGVVMAQSPGLLVGDTKLDLTIAPAEFLARAVHFWDAQGAFGQLQNQAYGYLWPMGPFFLLGSVVDLPGWVVQRLWLAVVMSTAFVGAAKTARAMGVRSELACLLAGFAYALSPRMLTTLGPISIEAWPSALAPWVLLPLVLGSRSGSPVRAAALSGFAVAMVGGVNAAATFAVLPLGALWLLTRAPGPRRRPLMLWWPVFILMGTLWWLVPLLVMGVYSPPFLDYIESAANTTFPTTVFDALRGTSDWVPYVDPSWRAGNQLIRDFSLPINSGVLLFLGLWGILQRRNPHRLFLSLGVLLGLCLVTLGHVDGVQGWWAAGVQGLLDGPLAPLRNVHKFDPVVRLPLVLGLAALVDDVVARLGEARRESRRDSRVGTATVRVVNLSVIVGTAVVAVFGAALPAAAGRITPGGAFLQVPDYWEETAAWLKERNSGTALLVPGSSFGRYVWGFPRDEPMQALGVDRWAVRNAVPLTPPGNIRMLNAIEDRLAQGEASAGLATYLRRAGVSHLVVRNDIARSADVPDPVLVHQAIEDSPGLVRVAVFGPTVGGQAHLPGKRGQGRILINGGWQDEYPAIEVYAVAGSHRSAVTSDSPPVVVGGPEDLLDLADLAVLGAEPTILAADLGGLPDPSQPLILTDGLRATERHFGRVHDGSSATLAPEDELRLRKPAPDYRLRASDRWLTTARTTGVRSLTASSSMSDASALGTVEPGRLPFAAVDGARQTVWTASPRQDEAAWWQATFDTPRPVDVVTITAGAQKGESVRVRTSQGLSERFDVPAGNSRVVPVGDDAAAWVRVEDASGRPGNRLTLADVEIPGLTVHRALVLPALPASWGSPDVVVLRAVTDARTGCAVVDGAVRCVAGREVASEEPLGFRRVVTVGAPAAYEASLTVRARPGRDFDELLLARQPVDASASSVGNPDTRASALAAVDGDPATTWTASMNDLRPVLRLSWLGERRVDRIRLLVADDTAARLPNELVLGWPGGRREVAVDDRGIVRFPAVTTDQLTLDLREAEPATSLDFGSNPSPVPVGVTELSVRGLPYLPITLPGTPVRLPCGTGPTLVVNGTSVETSVTASPAALYRGATVPAEPCGQRTVVLDAGSNEVDVLGSDVFVPESLVLADGPVTQSSVVAASHHEENAARGSVDPGAAGATLLVRQNANLGWQARQGGKVLPPVIVDGWQQGWRLAEAGTAVELTYRPDEAYRVGLLAGLLTFLALAACAAVPDRRWPDRELAALPPRELSTGALAALALVGGGVLAGWWGVAVAGAGFALARFLRRQAPEDGAWLVAVAVLPAAAAYAVRPWGESAGWAGSWEWPHYLVVAVCGGLFGWLAEGSWGLRRTFLSRIAGLSTRR